MPNLQLQDSKTGHVSNLKDIYTWSSTDVDDEVILTIDWKTNYACFLKVAEILVTPRKTLLEP